MILYGVIHESIEEFFYKKFSDMIDVLVQAFEQSSCLTWATCLLLLGATLYLSCCKYDDKHLSCSSLLLKLLAIEVLGFIGEDTHRPSSVLSFLPLCDFAAILIFANVVADVVRYMGNINIGRKFSEKNFTIDDDAPVCIDPVRAQYANDLLERFRNTENKSESFAIIIYGAWGSGKTVFLHHLQKCLLDKHEEILEFNPWNCQNSQQVASDFFELLANSLKRYDSSLEKPILRYSELLEAVDTPKLVDYVSGLLFEHGEGGNDLKEHISDTLQQIKVPIYVLIDDMDRMNGEEILAVLRLIRNTANFPYLKFIVTCDKKYLKERLDERHISLGYVEKIFMAEFYLPEIYSVTPLVDACKSDVQSMTDDNEIHNFLENLYDTKLVEESLGNIRQAKRFARELVLDWEFCKNNKTGRQNEILFSDYFWIELLKYTNSKAYYDLKKHPDEYFEKKKYIRYNTDLYMMKNAAIQQEDVNTEKMVMQILRKVFPSGNVSSVVTARSAALVENFDKYFSFGKAVGHITIAEYSSMLYHQENSEELVQKIAKMDSDLIASLLQLLMMTNGDKLNTLEAKKRYIDVLFAVGCRYGQSIITGLIEDKLIPFLENCSTEDGIKAYLSEKLGKKYQSYHEIVMVISICNKLLFQINMSHFVFLEEADLKNTMKQQFCHYLTLSHHDAAEVLSGRRELRRVLEASVVCVPITDEDGNFESNEYDCIVIDELITYFSAHKSHKRQAISDFETLDFTEDVPQWETEEAEENKREEIGQLFGNNSNFERFKQECFE